MAFSTPLICFSSGVMTVSAMVFGEAPGYWPLTTTVGGTISGDSLIGRIGIASRAATVMMMASTVAKIGRSMKNEEMFMELPRYDLAAGAGLSSPMVTFCGITGMPG